MTIKMPYIPKEDRPSLDEKVNALAEEIASRVISLDTGLDEGINISTIYKNTIISLANVLYELKTGVPFVDSEPKELERELAFEIRDKGAWLGGLNYSLTRLIQVVPKKMVEKDKWKGEFRYWLYAQTVGALERSALYIDSIGRAKTSWGFHEGDWVIDGIVGVLIDVKDEYKRRVNTAYEAVQIKKNGDCYDTPYRTELKEVKDEKGNIIGYQEIMKDFRGKK